VTVMLVRAACWAVLFGIWGDGLALHFGWSEWRTAAVTATTAALLTVHKPKERQ
jgi:hypothetical protein